jgi:hypothetical protein
MENNYDKKILEMLENTDKPTDIEKIRLEVGIGNWNTALAHCLGLLVAKKINGVKTSKSWVFWGLEKKAAIPA